MQIQERTVKISKYLPLVWIMSVEERAQTEIGATGILMTEDLDGEEKMLFKRYL